MCIRDRVGGAAAPDVTDRQGEGVGGVGGLGRGVEPEYPGDHGGDLGLVRPTGAGDGGLDLAGGVQRDGDAAPRRAQHRDGGGLRGAHHGADVVLREHPLDGDEFGRVAVEPLLQPAFDGEQPRAELVARRRPDDAHAEHVQLPPGQPVDDSDAAPGQPGVHSQYAHLPAPPLSDLRRLPPTTDNRSRTRLRPAAASSHRAEGAGAAQASSSAMISSETSKLAKTFCTSSLSSSASISLKILRAPSASSSTCMLGTKLASAES